MKLCAIYNGASPKKYLKMQYNIKISCSYDFEVSLLIPLDTEDTLVPHLSAHWPCGFPATGKKSLNSGGSSSSV